jgi:hypothetical protein
VRCKTVTPEKLETVEQLADALVAHLQQEGKINFVAGLILLSASAKVFEALRKEKTSSLSH